MKLKYLLLVVVFLTFSCSKEESLTSTTVSLDEKYTFPEGTPYDDITKSIYDEFGVRIIYKGLTPTYMNQTLKGLYKIFDIMDEELAGRSIRLVKDHVFSKIDYEFMKPVLKPYIYIAYDLRSPSITSYAPLKYEFEGLDFWIFCFQNRGKEFYPLHTPATFPETDAEIKVQRGIIMDNILRKMVSRGLIEVPQVFYNDFDYKTAIKVSVNQETDENYFMKRGFVGKYSPSFFIFSTIGYSITSENPQETFIKYMLFIAKFSKEDIEAGEKLGTGLYKNFPKILKYYDLVDNYMIEKYNYDLKQIQKL